MRFLAKILTAVLINAAGLWITSYLVPQFVLKEDIRAIFTTAGMLTILNFSLRPFLKLLLGPLMILTLGLGLVLLNGVILYILNFLSPDLNIQSASALIYATLVMSAINLIFHIATKR